MHLPRIELQITYFYNLALQINRFKNVLIFSHWLSLYHNPIVPDDDENELER